MYKRTTWIKSKLHKQLPWGNLFENQGNTKKERKTLICNWC